MTNDPMRFAVIPKLFNIFCFPQGGGGYFYHTSHVSQISHIVSKNPPIILIFFITIKNRKNYVDLRFPVISILLGALMCNQNIHSCVTFS